MTLIAECRKIDRLTVITDHFGRRFVECAWCGGLVPIGNEPPNPMGEFCDVECRLQNARHYS